MPVEFTKTANQIINFGLIPALHNLDQKTVMCRFRLDAWAAATGFTLMDKLGNSGNGWFVRLINAGGFVEALHFVHLFTGDNGVWYSNDNAVSVGTDYHVAVTYDRTATGNDPIFYLNGASIAVNEDGTPTGSAKDDSAEEFSVGNTADGVGNTPHDGKIWDNRVYNKILTAATIAEIANSKVFVIPSHGLVFHTPFLEADGKVKFDGVLGNTDFVWDYIGGIKGTPAGSPVAHQETEMAFPFANG